MDEGELIYHGVPLREMVEFVVNSSSYLFFRVAGNYQ